MAETASRPARWSWGAFALALAAVALALSRANPDTIDWQPALALTQPWRAWTAVWVHYSRLHLTANLAGALLVALLGQVAPVAPRAVLAWFVAWPLTQLGLLLQPELLHYGGLSGVLHAGVAVAAMHLWWAGSTAQRRIAVALLIGLALKLVHDAPWEGVLRHPAGWDIAVAPMAHVSGTAAGTICAGVAELVHRARPRPTIGR